MDREKVIKGLERCLVCNLSVLASEEEQKAYIDCEYTTGLYCRHDRLIRDAIDLLKEPQKKPQQIEMEGGGSTWWYVCPECHGAIDRQDHFCRHCGQAIEN